ncbi:polysaccharide deacetylase family sporulation protein PdaB [Clostridium sporogenes]|uniref:polysaccharide deacetylase family sporulation protein PdaB n=1 Tax=Clostridium sporogenes TaxID=1509 RepID=UPI00024BABC2|nr:polysaccharide deacetylase family sporulation protein PdaB [Clostridium sporogenes]EHN16982.1 polysaccharide deacetylase family protein [Clostridium sporogenes PA 3679]MBA4508358.1 polysaccharide deacetylase family sporulation protein PdaB [Clostridium sporogenes]MBW5458546.1 polysaccharide deacetylase family sporulation protein PdaB [Clostridium sporogenes]MCW6062661.1 polysaccharide deacetylase family sporulation protein PdaB [Clostridium sporogenes]MCW6070126.1 polysaccharide deacetylase
MKDKFKKRMVFSLLLLVLAISMSFFINGRGQNASLNIRKKVPIYRVDTKENKISLTFDVSRGDEYIEKILDILDENDVKATFFLVGDWIEQNPKKVKEIHSKGHEIGNHSHSHPNMSIISKEKIVKDININDANIRRITGEGTKLFRFPGGYYNDEAVDIVNKMGLCSIQWDVDSIDWKEQGADLEYERIIKKTKSGSILLFHNTAKYTPDNLPRIIKELKENGFQFVKVGDLIYKENYYIDSAGVQKKN